MTAVFKHELKSYFSNLTGYIFCAFILLFIGIYTSLYNLKAMITNFEYIPASMTFVFIVVIPILTMRVLSEERKQKTDQLLYSLPITTTDVIFGKYLAMVVTLLIPIVVMCIYPLILCAFGSIYLPAAYGAIFGFFLLGASLIAAGMFISSVTENQAISAGIIFVVVLMNYFLSTLAQYLSSSATASLIAFIILVLLLAVVVRLMTKSTTAAIITAAVLLAALILTYALSGASFEGLFATVISKLSLFDQFNQFVNGVFDLKSVVYFLSVIGIFAFLSVQSLEKRRWS